MVHAVMRSQMLLQHESFCSSMVCLLHKLQALPTDPQLRSYTSQECGNMAAGKLACLHPSSVCNAIGDKHSNRRCSRAVAGCRQQPAVICWQGCDNSHGCLCAATAPVIPLYRLEGASGMFEQILPDWLVHSRSLGCSKTGYAQLTDVTALIR
jgi:hypothetical protein